MSITAFGFGAAAMISGKANHSTAAREWRHVWNIRADCPNGCRRIDSNAWNTLIPRYEYPLRIRLLHDLASPSFR